MRKLCILLLYTFLWVYTDKFGVNKIWFIFLFQPEKFEVFLLFPNFLNIKLFDNSWCNYYTKFIVLDIKSRFAFGESTLHVNTVNCQKIIASIVDSA